MPWSRYQTLLLVVCFAMGCASGRPLPVAAVRPAPTEPPSTSRVAPLPPLSSPPPVTPQPQSSNAAGRRSDAAVADSVIAPDSVTAADSADLAVLDALADARVVGDDEDVDVTTPVTWDIDVESFSDHVRVQYYLDFFGSNGRERMGIWLNRMPRYEAMIRERLQREGLPADLLYLALIESGFSNTATSHAKAVGMWQFMKRTGEHYGLRVDYWVDDRRDPYLATDAAARHLRDLTERFGSVYLAAAAYNAGAGRVSRGLGKLPDDPDTDSRASDAMFFRLYDTQLLRRETKDYVPKLIAAARIAKEPARYGFTVEPTAPLTYDSLVVPDMTGLDVIAELADTTVAAIRELNPRYLRLATPPATPSLVRVPAGRGPSTRGAYAALPPRQRVRFVEHRIQQGETFSGIARRYGVSADAIARANPKINARRLQVGKMVVIPTGGGYPAPAAMASKTEKRAVAKNSSVSEWHRVRGGETLSEIADEYRVSVRNLRTWNGLSSSRILAGQRLRVTPPVSGAAGRKAKTRPV